MSTDTNTTRFPFTKIELSAIFTIAFVLANTFIFILQYGYLSYYGIAYDYINVSLTSLIISFIISVFTITICKIVMDTYTDIYTNMHAKNEKYYFQLKAEKILAKDIKKRRRRFFVVLIVSLLIYSVPIIVYIFCNLVFNSNPMNIDILDFILVFVGFPFLLAAFTFVLIRVNIYTIKLRQTLKDRCVYHFYPNKIRGFHKAANKTIIGKYTDEDFRKKLVTIYSVIAVVFLTVLMFFLFFSGGFIANHKTQYGTLCDTEEKKNYLVITAYSEYRIVMEYTYNKEDNSATIVYGKYQIVPLTEMNETIHKFDNVNFADDYIFE